MKLTLTIIFILFSTTTFSAVVKKSDRKNGCILYRIIEKDSIIQKQKDEVIVSDKSVYGISLTNLDIDFATKEVTVDVILNVVLGLNKPLLNSRSTIHSQNPNFNILINQLNRKLYVFEKICITKSNEIIYADFFPVE
jgi:hypothetical protein